MGSFRENGTGAASDLAAWRRGGRSVYIDVDNDQNSAAPADALRLAAILKKACRLAPA
jgi:uncharacterized protein YecE (DUF72 family)